MNGILTVNHFLKGEKYDTLHNHLVNSAKKCGINLNIKTNFFGIRTLTLQEELKKAVFPFSTLPIQLKNAMIKAEHILSLTALCLSLKHLSHQNAILNRI